MTTAKIRWAPGSAIAQCTSDTIMTIRPRTLSSYSAGENRGIILILLVRKACITRIRIPPRIWYRPCWLYQSLQPTKRSHSSHSQASRKPQTKAFSDKNIPPAFCKANQLIRTPEVRKYHLSPTDLIPNSPRPLLHYKNVLAKRNNTNCDPADVWDIFTKYEWNAHWIFRYSPTQVPYYHSYQELVNHSLSVIYRASSGP